MPSNTDKSLVWMGHPWRLQCTPLVYQWAWSVSHPNGPNEHVPPVHQAVPRITTTINNDNIHKLLTACSVNLNSIISCQDCPLVYNTLCMRIWEQHELWIYPLQDNSSCSSLQKKYVLESQLYHQAWQKNKPHFTRGSVAFQGAQCFAPFAHGTTIMSPSKLVAEHIFCALRDDTDYIIKSSLWKYF